MKFILFPNFFALSLLLTHVSILPQHFMYQPGYANNKIHINNDHNLSVKLFLSGGSTKKALDASGKKVDLLDLYGTQDGAYIFHGVDLSRLTGNLLALAQRLRGANLTNKSSLYGKLSVEGEFSIFNGGLTFARRVTDHFSMKISAPFHHFRIKNISNTSLTPANEMNQDILNGLINYPDFLNAYNISSRDIRETTMGDIQLFFNAHVSREGDDILGDINASATVGVTLPTARQTKINQAFYIPMGNNGHVGFPIAVDAHLNVHTYVDLNVHFGSEFFLQHDSVFRMKTNINQNGFIKLASGPAREKLGVKFDVDGRVCLHTESRNLGIVFAYRYEHQRKSTLTPLDTITFNKTIVNTDTMLAKWDRQNITISAFYCPEIESSEHNNPCPHIKVSFTQPVKGSQIFKTNLVGGALGIDFSWNF